MCPVKHGLELVWSCITDSALNEIFVCEDRIRRCPRSVKFQKDRAPWYKSVRMIARFRDISIELLDWSGQHPDMYPSYISIVFMKFIKVQSQAPHYKHQRSAKTPPATKMERNMFWRLCLLALYRKGFLQ